LQHGQAFEVVGRNRLSGVVGANPPLTGQEARHPLPFGDMLGVVPIIELAGVDIREIHSRNEHTVCHGFPP
jgi:hypothetical protein